MAQQKVVFVQCLCFRQKLGREPEGGPRTRTASARIRAADTIFLLIENLNLIRADPRGAVPPLYCRHLKPPMRFYDCKYFKKSTTFFEAFYTHIVGFSIVAFSSVNMASETHNRNFITEIINSTYEAL